MSSRPHSFKKTDVARAVAAVRSAGLEVVRVDVDASGKISVVLGKPSGDTGANPWDEHHDQD